MSSGIDATKPTAGTALTADVRNNFSSAEDEINELHFLTRDTQIAGGTADVLTVTNTNPIASYVDGMMWVVQAASDNATTTPTLNVDAKGAKTIVKTGGDALVASDIQTDMMCLFKFDSANDRMEYLNPAIDLTQIDHDTLLNFIANKHIDHSAVNIDTTEGLQGGGDITATRTLKLDIDGLAADTSPTNDDFVATFDVTGAVHKKVLLSDIGAIVSSNFATTGHFQIGAFIINFGQTTVSADSTATATWNKVFPTAVLQAVACQGENFDASEDAGAAIYNLSTTGATVQNGAGVSSGSNQVIRWFAVGH